LTSSITQQFRKDPSATLDFTFDWSAWLPTGDTISSVTWAISTGVTLASSPAPSHTTTTATTFVSGGTAGTSYILSCTITTAQGRIDTRSLTIAVVDL
jgi:hypothetical protein